MAPKRKNPGSSSAIVTRNRISQRLEELKQGAPTLRPEIWQQLPEHPLDVVLSYLPAHKLVDTVKVLTRWKDVLEGTSPFAHELLGHGRNMHSSYGFLAYTCREIYNVPIVPVSLIPVGVEYHDKLQIPALSALEHETGEWVKLPPMSASQDNSTFVMSIESGSDGLLCVTKTVITDSGVMQIGIWNPLMHSKPIRWLPAGDPATALRLKISPLDHYGLVTSLNLMVDEASRSYKLVAVLMTLGQGERFLPWGIPEFLQSKINVPRYCVYDSKSQQWSSLQYLYKAPEIFNSRRTRAPIFFTGCRPVSCNRHVFLVSRKQDGEVADADEVIHCYSSERDDWTQLRMSKISLDLGYVFRHTNARKALQERCRVSSLVVLGEKLYIVVKKVVHAQFYIAVVDLKGDNFGPDSVVECLTRVSPFEGRECKSRVNYEIVHWYGCEIGGRGYICGILDHPVRDSILKVMIDVETKAWVQPCLVGCGCSSVDDQYHYVCGQCVSKRRRRVTPEQRGRNMHSYHVPFKASWVPV